MLNVRDCLKPLTNVTEKIILKKFWHVIPRIYLCQPKWEGKSDGVMVALQFLVLSV